MLKCDEPCLWVVMVEWSAAGDQTVSRRCVTHDRVDCPEVEGESEKNPSGIGSGGG